MARTRGSVRAISANSDQLASALSSSTKTSSKRLSSDTMTAINRA
jgi:hypothetical protein